MMGMMLALAANAGCPDDSDARVLVEARQVLQAYDASDAELLASARAGLDRSLPCMSAEAASPLLETLHRAMALVAYADRDRDASTRAWRALRRLDPSLRPDPRRFAKGHGMWSVYASSGDASSSVTALPDRPKGGWWVDGARAAVVPDDRAFVLSARSKRGELFHTGYYFRPHEIPTFEANDAVPRPETRRRGTVVLAIGSGLLVAGAGLVTWAGVDELALNGGRLDVDDVRDTARSVNRRYRLGYVVGGVGLAVGAVGATVRW